MLNWIKNNLIKKKFKVILLLLTNLNFLCKIRRIKRLIRDKELQKIPTFVRLDKLKQGHQIIYPEYVQELIKKPDTLWDMAFSIYNDDFIKVVADGDKFLVVDGNHRTAAIKEVYGNGKRKVRVQVYVNKKKSLKAKVFPKGTRKWA